MANDNATTGIDSISQLDGDDMLIISAADQIQELDFFDGGTETNTIVFSNGGPDPVTLLLFDVLTDGSHGFHNYGAVGFVGVAFTAVWLDAEQFGAGLISTSLAISGTDGVGASLIILGASNFSAAAFTFSIWQQTNDIFTNHKISIVGTNGADTLTGNDATSNNLSGDDGNDTLNGAALSDEIFGGLGQDTLTGGDDADTFFYETKAESRKGAGRDVITDFSGVNGGELDLIDLSFIDAKKGAGNQIFKFIGGHKFHDRAGELQVKYNAFSDIAIVQGDINGDGRADFQIQVDSDFALVKADFIL
jgi:Ca2+-binding RTX toxin-like protein